MDTQTHYDGLQAKRAKFDHIVDVIGSQFRRKKKKGMLASLIFLFYLFVLFYFNRFFAHECMQNSSGVWMDGVKRARSFSPVKNIKKDIIFLLSYYGAHRVCIRVRVCIVLYCIVLQNNGTVPPDVAKIKNN